MIKRVVILQDEQLVVREIERNMQRTAALQVAAVAPLQFAAAAAVPVSAGMGAFPGCVSAAPNPTPRPARRRSRLKKAAGRSPPSPRRPR